MKYRHFVLTAILAVVAGVGHAQRTAEQHIDSLKEMLGAALSKADQARIYGDLCWFYNTVSLDSAFHYGSRSLEIAEEIQDRKLIAQSSSDLGALYFVKGEIDRSLELYEHSLGIRLEDGDEAGIASLHFKLGGIYYKKAQWEEAMKFFLKALAYYEEEKNENVLANLYSNIAVVYTALHNYPKALSYLERAKVYFETHEMHAPLANTLLAIGNVHYSMQDTLRALEVYMHTIEIAKKGNNFVAEAAAYNNVGSIHTDKGNRQLAVSHVKKAIEIRTREKLGADAASSQITLAINYAQMGRYTQAKALLLNSLEYFREHGAGEKIGTVYFQLIAVYAGLGKRDSVFHYMTLYERNQSAELNKKVIEVSNELETKYETEKKVQQISLLNQEKAIQELELRQRGLLLIVALGVLLAGAVIVFFILKHRKLKADARLQAEIASQQEKSTRDVLDAEERERRRIAGDLHDGVGQSLSAALLNLDYLGKEIARGNPPDPQLMDNALALVRNSYQETRNISHQMMPNALLKGGLAASIKEFLDAIDGKEIKVHLSITGLTERLGQQLETVLYRTVQEATNNVIKHAAASRLAIQLMKDQEGISVTIEDNGKGFDRSRANYAEGIGLRNIRSRIALMNGLMEVDTAPGRGTVLAIHIPL